MAEQKVLMARAGKTSVREEKVEILKRVKEVIKELEELDKPKPETEDVEMEGDDDKSRLDKELEKHGMDTKEKRDEAELLKLHSQLAALKDKVSTMYPDPDQVQDIGHADASGIVHGHRISRPITILALPYKSKRARSRTRSRRERG
jgi:predicted nuclease with TOPRIM domain